MEHLYWSTMAHNPQQIVQQQQLTLCVSSDAAILTIDEFWKYFCQRHKIPNKQVYFLIHYSWTEQAGGMCMEKFMLLLFLS